VDDDATLRLLQSIDRRLALLTGPQERELQARLSADVLRTDARVAMFDAIDGKRGSPEIAKLTGASERAVQMFVKDLLDDGFARVVPSATSRGLVVEKDEEAIVQWYVRRPRGENGSR
jgi:hypothetical protein